MIDDHWFRAGTLGEPCTYQSCEKPFEEHVEACGEWMEPRHWYIPFPGGCLACGRHWRHSTHRLVSPRGRSLWLWPRVRGWFFSTKDRVRGTETCMHFSHRMKLPCLREAISSCSVLCRVHYDSCREGCR